jgi:hypothetical protein
MSFYLNIQSLMHLISFKHLIPVPGINLDIKNAARNKAGKIGVIELAV